MKFKFKDLEFIFKKIFISQSYLLKKRLIRAIKNNYEKELPFIDRFSDMSKDALDIGVYRGVYSFKLSKNFKKVHAFEPNTLLFPYLNKNLKKIIKNIELYNLALSDKKGDAELKLPIRTKSFFNDNIEELYQLGAASMHPHKEFEEFKKVRIKKDKLDNLTIDNHIGFIKIDVEGHELEVINGAIRTIQKNKPILLVEIEKRHSKRSVEETIKHISNLGYDCFFANDQKLISIEKLNDKNLENNYFFLPN
tara:strand:+ start:1662 stop:2414 length:753 start_codon:yes stop_codon:yes gene_type:complete